MDRNEGSSQDARAESVIPHFNFHRKLPEQSGYLPTPHVNGTRRHPEAVLPLPHFSRSCPTCPCPHTSVSPRCVPMNALLCSITTHNAGMIPCTIICLLHLDPTLCEGKGHILPDHCCTPIWSTEVVSENFSHLPFFKLETDSFVQRQYCSQ